MPQQDTEVILSGKTLARVSHERPTAAAPGRISWSRFGTGIRRKSGLACLLILLVLCGCSVNRYVVAPYDKITLQAAREVNPNPAGRPSPVRVLVFELAGRATFDNLDFDGLYNNADVLLGEDLLSLEARMLQPGEAVEHRIELHPKARFVAVIAAYRDIDRAGWKRVYEVNPNWYHSHDVVIGESQIVLADDKSSEQADALADTAEALGQEVADKAVSEAANKITQSLK